MIAFCLPSRGLIFSRTVESIFNGTKILKQNNIDSELFVSHDKPIPESHNFVVSEALKTSAEKIFLIEEDNFLFPEAYLEMIRAPYDVTTIQYNDKNGSPHGIIHYNEQSEILWGGLGSTVVNRNVFETLGEPYFRTDHLYKNIKKHLKDGKLITEYEEVEPRQVWNEEDNKFIEQRDEYKYGGLDIDGYTRWRKAGFSIGIITNHKGHHFELMKLGDKYTNNGIHTIRQV